MKLIELAVPTLVVRPGMTLREVFRECVRCSVGGLPYADAEGRICGRVSLRHIVKHTCIPDFLVGAAHYLGDNIDNVDLPEARRRAILAEEASGYVLESRATISAGSPLIKGLAIMERYNSSYLFLVDAGEYRGVVTRMAIVGCMLARDEEDV
ncbi:hypothetical protein MARPU_00275 [Marichromatium purpuratum 984]|uniref:CBS domain-containing protein n=1 Tax=Marichromatium purpuratum 984 TaxID=765910 RepID=W0DYV4_MARPU|nr:CBS domain-containing protein [Marichromatium purpuratum]AHF02458.1 hypothetical protein MARPU_00275 [Marichromatium purpuratum 984]